MKNLDKKQIPQFAALCVISAGVFGYFVVKIATPSPAAAGTRPHPAAEASLATPITPATAKKTGDEPDTAPASSEGDAPEANAPAPTPGMRDPFVVGYVEPKTQSVPPTGPALPAAPGKSTASLTPPVKAAAPQVASIHEAGPAPLGLPGLPFGLKSLSPLPAVPVPVAPKPTALEAPAWTVTGVLQNETGQVAVLRSGEARRIVRTGDFVDSVYQVVAVTRTAVVLRHDKTFYHLILGAAKPADPTPAGTPLHPISVPSSLVPAVSVPSPAPKPLGEPQTASLEPLGNAVGMEAGLAQVLQAALLMARSYMTPAQAQVDACLASFHAHTENAQASFDLSRDVYADGQAGAGIVQWHCALATNDLGTPDDAGNLLDRYN